MSHVDGATAGRTAVAPTAGDHVTPFRAAGAAWSDRTTTMALPATRSDCDRSAQLAESAPGVVFAGSNGTR